MSDAAPLIPYASDGLEQPPDRLLRRIVAWSAILYGGQAVAGTALHVALAKGWAASPASMSWGFDNGWDMVVTATRALMMSALVVGGVLMLGRSRAGVVVLRAGAAGSIVMAVVGLALVLRASPVYASYWSTPAAAGINTVHFLQGLWPPVLIALLTLPPLARRMV